MNARISSDEVAFDWSRCPTIRLLNINCIEVRRTLERRVKEGKVGRHVSFLNKAHLTAVVVLASSIFPSDVSSPSSIFPLILCPIS